PDFETMAVPARPLVPWVEAVHDRISIEIMRGCPQVCRFCHAGNTKRPLRYRSVERVLEIAEQAYAATGYDEIGLLSLSTADYPRLPELARQVNERFGKRMVNISFPSLRVDRMLRHIPWMANSVRKSGLTIAVEAGSERLRRAIRKKVTDGNLMEGVRAAYEAGWKRVKLYFMVGFPGETPADIEGIVDTSRAIAEERRQLGRPPAFVNVSLSWLVPKPFTPMQWMAQPRAEYFQEVRQQLGARLRQGPKYIRLRMHDVRRSILEAVFARGDRRLGVVIEEAWRQGARLDAWDENFDHAIWQQAFTTCGVDPDWYAHRERSFDELLPWDHIGQHLPRSYLERACTDLCCTDSVKDQAAT
ncbi:MAG: radical SAM protein, partial [Planctomycetota bacterium]